ncbi:conserved membrane protein, unknown function [Hepatocystis sp. ex Piliocolobus tephrosceles]|nr:conserved membrane protein, unknown function [Hepatocystis sp. ex Piliocolobus tephrosceles]
MNLGLNYKIETDDLQRKLQALKDLKSIKTNDLVENYLIFFFLFVKKVIEENEEYKILVEKQKENTKNELIKENIEKIKNSLKETKHNKTIIKTENINFNNFDKIDDNKFSQKLCHDIVNDNSNKYHLNEGDNTGTNVVSTNVGIQGTGIKGTGIKGTDIGDNKSETYFNKCKNNIYITNSDNTKKCSFAKTCSDVIYAFQICIILLIRNLEKEKKSNKNIEHEQTVHNVHNSFDFPRSVNSVEYNKKKEESHKTECTEKDTTTSSQPKINKLQINRLEINTPTNFNNNFNKINDEFQLILLYISLCYYNIYLLSDNDNYFLYVSLLLFLYNFTHFKNKKITHHFYFNENEWVEYVICVPHFLLDICKKISIIYKKKNYIYTSLFFLTYCYFFYKCTKKLGNTNESCDDKSYNNKNNNNLYEQKKQVDIEFITIFQNISDIFIQLKRYTLSNFLVLKCIDLHLQKLENDIERIRAKHKSTEKKINSNKVLSDNNNVNIINEKRDNIVNEKCQFTTVLGEDVSVNDTLNKIIETSFSLYNNIIECSYLFLDIHLMSIYEYLIFVAFYMIKDVYKLFHLLKQKKEKKKLIEYKHMTYRNLLETYIIYLKYNYLIYSKNNNLPQNIYKNVENIYKQEKQIMKELQLLLDRECKRKMSGNDLEKMNGNDLEKMNGNNLEKMNGNNLEKMNGNNLEKMNGNNLEKMNGNNLEKVNEDDLEKVNGNNLEKVNGNNLEKVNEDDLEKMNSLETVDINENINVNANINAIVNANINAIVNANINAIVNANINAIVNANINFQKNGDTNTNTVNKNDTPQTEIFTHDNNSKINEQIETNETYLNNLLHIEEENYNTFHDIKQYNFFNDIFEEKKKNAYSVDILSYIISDNNTLYNFIYHNFIKKNILNFEQEDEENGDTNQFADVYSGPYPGPNTCADTSTSTGTDKDAHEQMSFCSIFYNNVKKIDKIMERIFFLIKNRNMSMYSCDLDHSSINSDSHMRNTSTEIKKIPFINIDIKNVEEFLKTFQFQVVKLTNMNFNICTFSDTKYKQLAIKKMKKLYTAFSKCREDRDYDKFLFCQIGGAMRETKYDSNCNNNNGNNGNFVFPYYINHIHELCYNYYEILFLFNNIKKYKKKTLKYFSLFKHTTIYLDIILNSSEVYFYFNFFTKTFDEYIKISLEMLHSLSYPLQFLEHKQYLSYKRELCLRCAMLLKDIYICKKLNTCIDNIYYNSTVENKQKNMNFDDNLSGNLSTELKQIILQILKYYFLFLNTSEKVRDRAITANTATTADTVTTEQIIFENEEEKKSYFDIYFYVCKTLSTVEDKHFITQAINHYQFLLNYSFKNKLYSDEKYNEYMQTHCKKSICFLKLKLDEV